MGVLVTAARQHPHRGVLAGGGQKMWRIFGRGLEATASMGGGRGCVAWWGACWLNRRRGWPGSATVEWGCRATAQADSRSGRREMSGL